MAYDSVRGVTVMFGGRGNTSTVDDTWEWNGATWTRLTPEIRPPARFDHAMTYDSARGVTVLFGGHDGYRSLGDTWEWDGTTWTEYAAGKNSPPARAGHSMAYDSVRGVSVLFGGYNYDGNEHYFDETWEWDGTSWTQRNPSNSPTARGLHSMAYDFVRGVMVLFGGRGSNGYLNDTWEWDGSDWAPRSSAMNPSVRYGHAIVYDSARAAIVLFGGYGRYGIDGVTFLSDTWEWNGTTWMQRTPMGSPAARSHHAMAYDSARSIIVMFGGSVSAVSLQFVGDTWEWNGTDWSQHDLGISPSVRSLTAMAFDRNRGVTVLFGRQLFVQSGKTWEWNGTTWMHRSPAINPAARIHHAMTYDSARSVTVLFGGYNNNGPLGDTWEWDGTNWIQRNLQISPPALSGHAMAYDSTRGVAVLCGGGETWEWDGTNWTHRSPETSSQAWGLHAMVYDSARNVTVLFGGVNSIGGTLGDTWEWNGTTWTQRSPATSPPARYVHAMTYDAARGLTVLFGGSGDNYLNDTWAWDGTNWTQRSLTNNPLPRYGHAMAYDSVRGINVLYGGLNGESTFADTWAFGPAGPAPTITQNPASPLVCENSAVSLRATATGNGTLSYKWRKNGNDLADDEDTFGTHSDTLVFARAHPGDAGIYDCLVMLNDCTRATSNAATLTVYPTGNADGNGDSLSDGRDIQAFIDSLINHDPVSNSLCAYDHTADGVVDLADVPGFTQKMLGL